MFGFFRFGFFCCCCWFPTTFFSLTHLLARSLHFNYSPPKKVQITRTHTNRQTQTNERTTIKRHTKISVNIKFAFVTIKIDNRRFCFGSRENTVLTASQRLNNTKVSHQLTAIPTQSAKLLPWMSFGGPKQQQQRRRQQWRQQ